MHQGDVQPGTRHAIIVGSDMSRKMSSAGGRGGWHYRWGWQVALWPRAQQEWQGQQLPEWQSCGTTRLQQRDHTSGSHGLHCTVKDARGFHLCPGFWPHRGSWRCAPPLHMGRNRIFAHLTSSGKQQAPSSWHVRHSLHLRPDSRSCGRRPLRLPPIVGRILQACFLFVKRLKKPEKNRKLASNPDKVSVHFR